ncbi:MAG: hypothetical protein AB7S26_34745 [Sandaracinaceae bacterium]
MTRIVTLVVAAQLFGCTSGSVPVGHEEHTFEDGRTVDLGTHPWRALHRMDVDQLDDSIREVTGNRVDGELVGGIGWDRWATRTGGEYYVAENYFETYGDTLGVPDYINSSTEDRSVSLLFEKFLDDAARDVCRRLVDREAGEGRPYDGDPQGIFSPVDLTSDTEPSQADVDQALSSLLLRFHGRPIEPSDQQLDPWRAHVDRLNTAIAAADPPIPARRAWEGVCVALITHPDFYTY